LEPDRRNKLTLQLLIFSMSALKPVLQKKHSPAHY
jgi:hypothetical protein